MKTYKLTAKQNGKRNTRSCNNTMMHKAPKSYCKPYWDSDKARSKNEIKLFLKGVDESELNFHYHHRNCASWDYW